MWTMAVLASFYRIVPFVHIGVDGLQIFRRVEVGFLEVIEQSLALGQLIIACAITPSLVRTLTVDMAAYLST